MTQTEADIMRKWVKSLTVVQLGKLWVWISAEFGAKIAETYKPRSRR